MKVKKTDRRTSGHEDFKRFVEFSNDEQEKFINCRNWCWDQWGPSCELEFWETIKNKNPAWCWLVDNWRIRIYLATEKEAQWFYLRWK